MPPYTHFKNLSFTDNLAQGAKGVEVPLTTTFSELNTLSGTPVTVETTATPASGSCGIQFVFKDAAGVTMAVPSSGIFYISEVATGLTHDLADTTFAVLTNGALTNIGGAGPSLYTTTAAGLLGATITAAADDYYVVFVLPSGLLLISTVCTVNA
jgi:hypothetical protein